MAVMGPRPRAEPRTAVSSKLKAKVVTKGFDQGQVDPRVHHRTDAPQIIAAAKRMRNWAIVTGGSAARRPGAYLRNTANIEEDATRIERITLGGVDVTLVFSPAQLDVIKESDWSLEAQVTSCPWVAGDLPTLQISILDTDLVQVVSRSFWPRRLRRTSAGSWSLLSLASSSGYPAYFDVAGDGQILAPFRRIAPKDIDLTPGALSGSTTFELGPAAQSWFESTHAPNGLLRYHGKQILVTIFTDGDTVTGAALGSAGLFPTHTLTVGSTAPFAPGDPIQGDDTGVQATVAEIINATSMDVIYEGYSTFDVTTPERIVGPNGYTTASASVLDATEQASVQWDEAMISDFAGYPGGTLLHKGRNYLFDLAKSLSWLTASVANSFFDFSEGEGELEDAIVDGIGADQNARIRYGVSTEQLLLFTTKGSYFVGESPEVPVSATTWNVNLISSIPIGDCAPIVVGEDDIAFASGSRIHAVTPSGNTRHPWVVSDLDSLAGGFDEEEPDDDFEPVIRTPHKLAFTAGLGKEKSRYLYGANEDGSLCVFRHERDSEIGGWTLWHTGSDHEASGFIDIAARDKSLLALVDLGGARRLVEFSFAALLDGELDYSTAATAYANETGLVLTQNGVKLYDGSINGSGEFVRSDNSEVVDPAAGLAVGWDFTTRLIPTPPTNAELGAMVVEVQGVLVKLVDTQAVTIQDETITSLQGYTQTPDVDDVLPRRTWIPDVITFADSGEDDMREPELVIEQTSAARCTVSAISWRVAYGDG